MKSLQLKSAKQPINHRGKPFLKTLLLRRHISVRSPAFSSVARGPILHSRVVAVDTVCDALMEFLTAAGMGIWTAHSLSRARARTHTHLEAL